MTAKLTDNQMKALRRIARSITPERPYPPISPVVASQLARKGMVQKMGTWDRKEWNRTVATLWKVCLTDAGRTAIGS